MLTRAGCTTAAIAERKGVHVRTVQRYKARLRARGLLPFR